MDKLEQLYKLVAGSGDYERFLDFLNALHYDCADIRGWHLAEGETRSEMVSNLLGRVELLTTVIDKLQKAHNNLQQQSRPLETEHD